MKKYLLIAILFLNFVLVSEENQMSTLSISEQLAFNTVRITCQQKNGSTVIGTGFFVDLSESPNMSIPIIITNKHLIIDSVKGTFVMTLKNSDNRPEIGKTVRLDINDFESQWIKHPDKNIDLAAMPIAPLLNEARLKNIQVFFITFGFKDVADEEYLENLNLIEEVTMIGYPVGIWDSKNNMPIFRMGSTATHPGIDYEGNPYFLIDLACFPGSSGSPVLLLNQMGFSDKKGDHIMATRMKLLGVLFAGPQYDAKGEIKVVKIPVTKTRISSTNIPTNLGIVIKSYKILDFKDIIK